MLPHEASTISRISFESPEPMEILSPVAKRAPLLVLLCE
jgi:hypothetical protein